MIKCIPAVAFLCFSGLPVQIPRTESAAKTAPKRSRTYKLVPPPADFSPPILNIPEPIHDCGTVIRGEEVIHHFTIKNTGGTTLRIEKVRTSCRRASYDREIPPDGEGKVTLRVCTRRRKGSFEETAHIYSNASLERQPITLKGKIFSPFDVNLSRPIEIVQGVEPRPMTIELRRTTRDPIEWMGAKITSGNEHLVDVGLEEVKHGDLYCLKITEKNIRATSARYQRVEISVQIVIKGTEYSIPVRVGFTRSDRIVVSPSSVYFHNRVTRQLQQENSAPVTRSLEIKSLDPDHAFKITRLEVQGTIFKAETKTIEAGRRYKLLVTLAKLPASGARRITEKIMVETDDPLVPKITVNATANFAFRPPKTRESN